MNKHGTRAYRSLCVLAHQQKNPGKAIVFANKLDTLPSARICVRFCKSSVHKASRCTAVPKIGTSTCQVSRCKSAGVPKCQQRTYKHHNYTTCLACNAPLVGPSMRKPCVQQPPKHRFCQPRGASSLVDAITRPPSPCNDLRGKLLKKCRASYGRGGYTNTQDRRDATICLSCMY